MSIDELLDAFQHRMAAYKGSQSSLEDLGTDSWFIEGGCLPSQSPARSTQGPDDFGFSNHESNNLGVEVESGTMSSDELLDASAPRSIQGPDDLGFSHHESNALGVQVFEIDPTLMKDAFHFEPGSKYKGRDSGMKVFDIDPLLFKAQISHTQGFLAPRAGDHGVENSPTFGHGKRFACPHRGCMKTFGRAWNCQRHYIATHRTKEQLRKEGSTHACGKCGRDYKNKSDLKKHFNRCSNNISRNK